MANEIIPLSKFGGNRVGIKYSLLSVTGKINDYKELQMIVVARSTVINKVIERVLLSETKIKRLPVLTIRNCKIEMITLEQTSAASTVVYLGYSL